MNDKKPRNKFLNAVAILIAAAFMLVAAAIVVTALGIVVLWLLDNLQSMWEKVT